MSNIQILWTAHYKDKVAQSIMDGEIDGRLVKAMEADRSPLASTVEIIQDEHKRIAEDE